MKSARTRTKHSSYSIHHLSLASTSICLLFAVLAPASCGPQSQGPFGWGQQQYQPGKPGPLASGMPPFSAVDTGIEGNQQAAPEPNAGVDPRVQSFVARFPADDRDRQGRAVPSQSPAPADGATGNSLTARPPTAKSFVTSPPAKAAPPATTQTPPANRPVQAMQPVEMLATPPAAASKGGTDAQASPQPLINKNLSPLPEPGRPRVELIDIRPAVGVTTRPSDVEPMAPANQPVRHPAGAPTADLGAFLSALEESVKAHPEQLDDQFRLHLLYLATDQDDKAAGPITAADPALAGLATSLFQVMTTARTVLRQPTSAPAPALMAAEELRRLLGQQASVIIPKIALVTRVNSFGDYEAVNPPKFPAGQGVHVFLYTEVANFRSEPTTDSRLRTLLSEKVEIFDAAGKVIWQQAADNIEDKVLSPRRDFFIPLELRLPASLPPGEYVVKATIEDKLGATTDQQRMTFTIGE